jgi:hypothetical protein
MDEQIEIDDRLVHEKGGTWELNLAPHDKMTIALNGVIAKEIVALNWTTAQIKTWQQIRKQ